MSIELKSQPRPDQQCRKADDKVPNGVDRYRTVDPQPQTAHGEDRDSNRLEDGPLLVLGPTPKAAPDGRENAGKAGEAAENAVQKAHARIRRCAATLNGLHRGPGQAISAVEHEHHADGDADVVRTRPFENRHAQRDSKGRPQQEWPQPTPAQRVAQFPDRDALHDKTEGDDQRRGLYRREDVQPNAGGNQSECKPCHPRDKRGRKGRRQINGNVDDRSVHRSLTRLCVDEWQPGYRHPSPPAFDLTAYLSLVGKRECLHQSKASLRWERLFKAVLKLNLARHLARSSLTFRANIHERRCCTTARSRGLTVCDRPKSPFNFALNGNRFAPLVDGPWTRRRET